MKKLFEAIKNIKNSSRPVPPEGDVSDVYGGPICPRLSVLSCNLYLKVRLPVGETGILKQWVCCCFLLAQ